jgi:hypothetical protein
LPVDGEKIPVTSSSELAGLEISVNIVENNFIQLEYHCTRKPVPCQNHSAYLLPTKPVASY